MPAKKKSFLLEQVLLANRIHQPIPKLQILNYTNQTFLQLNLTAMKQTETNWTCKKIVIVAKKSRDNFGLIYQKLVVGSGEQRKQLNEQNEKSSFYAKLNIDNGIRFVYCFVKNWGDINKKGHYFGVFFEHAHCSHHLATLKHILRPHKCVSSYESHKFVAKLSTVQCKRDRM